MSGQEGSDQHASDTGAAGPTHSSGLYRALVAAGTPELLADQPVRKYVGSNFIAPGFLGTDPLLNLGVPPHKLKLEWYTSVGAFDSALHGVMKAIQSGEDGDPGTFTLQVTRDGARFKGKGADLKQRVARCWPSHDTIERWMTARRELDDATVKTCYTLEDQYTVISTLDGWEGVEQGDLTAIEQLMCTCQLIYFGASRYIALLLF